MSTKPRTGILARLAGFAPVAVPPHVFALEPRRLRYAAFGREAAGLRLLDVREAALAPDAFQIGPLGGPLRDPEAFAAVVAGLLERLGAPVKEASLVVPDAWLRVAFAETGDLPRQDAARDEVLRWMLRRLVPFRVDELRVAGEEVLPLPEQKEPRRVLLGFGVEALLAQIEDAFAACGVRLGAVTNPSLALLDALRGAPENALSALVMVEESSYTVLFARAGAAGLEPVLHRFKAWSAATQSGEARASLAARDLRLTRTFVEESLPGMPVSRALLWAPPAEQAAWLDLLQEGLACPASALGPEHLPVLPGGLPAGAWGWPMEGAPLLGAACREVA